MRRLPRDPLTRSSERGETLAEVLVTIAIVGLAIVILVGALADSILASSNHRQHATADTVARSIAENIEREGLGSDVSPGCLERPCADRVHRPSADQVFAGKCAGAQEDRRARLHERRLCGRYSRLAARHYLGHVQRTRKLRASSDHQANDESRMMRRNSPAARSRRSRSLACSRAHLPCVGRPPDSRDCPTRID